MKKTLKHLLPSILIALAFLVVQMQLSQAMDEKTPITFVQSDGTRMIMKVNLGQRLSDLRLELSEKGRMTTNDIFRQDLSDIFRDDETDWTIREVIKDNALSLKPRNSPSSQIFGDIKSPPKKADASQFMRSATFNLKPSPIEIPELLSHDNGVSETVNMASYGSLSEAERTSLCAFLGLKKTFNITADSQAPSLTEEVIKRSVQQTIKWIGEPEARRPDVDLKISKFCSYSKIHHELIKSGIVDIKASASYLGIGVDTEYKSKSEMLKSHQETEVYTLATYDVPKIILMMPLKFIKATDEFEAEIESLGDNDDIGVYKKLIGILGNYGFYVATEFHLGGQLWIEGLKKVKTSEDAILKTTEFAASLEANLFSTSASIGAGIANATSNKIAQAKMQQRITVNAKGGDSAKTDDRLKWMSSLGPWTSWNVIKIDNFKPVIDVLRIDLKTKCEYLIGKYCQRMTPLTFVGMKEALCGHENLAIRRDGIDEGVQLYKLLCEKPLKISSLQEVSQRLIKTYQGMEDLYLIKTQQVNSGIYTGYRSSCRVILTCAKTIFDLCNELEFSPLDDLNLDAFSTGGYWVASLLTIPFALGGSLNQYCIEQANIRSMMHYRVSELDKLIKEDIHMCMGLYLKLHHKHHAFWDEFRKICNL